MRNAFILLNSVSDVLLATHSTSHIQTGWDSCQLIITIGAIDISQLLNLWG